MNECLQSSSDESDADSCCRHGYEYNHDAIDMFNTNEESNVNEEPSQHESTSIHDSSAKSCDDKKTKFNHHPSDDDYSESNDDSSASSSSSSSSDDRGSSSTNSNHNKEPNTSKKPTGRPTGSDKAAKYARDKIEGQAKYKIFCRYVNELPDVKLRGITKRALFESIVDEEKYQSNLEETFVFNYETALSRIRRKSMKGNGTFSPLSEIEPQLVQLVLCMSKIKRTLTMSEGLHLCNELIAGTEIQQKLIEFKISRQIYAGSVADLGRVGRHYWKKFLLRNKNELRAKPGRKYAVDSSSWTTIMNFSDMYEHVEEIMCQSNIAHKLSSPQWMDKDGNVLENEEGSLGCKVQVSLDRPDCALVLDEVGCNLSQDCDNRIGGELYLTGAKDEAYRTISTHHQHFTVLGVTVLDGSPVLCVVIFAGKKWKFQFQLALIGIISICH